MYVVCYGTLKRGYGNNRFLRDATFVQECTVDDHKLYTGGFPVAAPSVGEKIKGELWDIGNPSTDAFASKCVQGMDMLEGYYYDNLPRSMYHRLEVHAVGDNGTVYAAQMYIGNPRVWRDFENKQLCPIVDGAYRWDR